MGCGSSLSIVEPLEQPHATATYNCKGAMAAATVGTPIVHTNDTNDAVVVNSGVHSGVPFPNRLPRPVWMRESREVVTAIQEYILLSYLGEGAFGTVHLARRKADGVKVALKRVRCKSSLVRRNEVFAEAHHVMSLPPHPHIVTCYRVFCDEDAVLIEMERMGKDLAETVKHLHEQNRLLKLSYVQMCIRQIASALVHVHRHGLVHRDLKLSNVFTAYDDAYILKLGDFGLACRAEKKDKEVCGTVFYMSPEMFDDEQYSAASAASDMWALGCFIILLCLPILALSSKGLKTVVATLSNSRLEVLFSLFTTYRYDPGLVELVRQLLRRSPHDRLTAAQVLQHPFLTLTNGTSTSTTPTNSITVDPFSSSSSFMTTSQLTTINKLQMSTLSHLFVNSNDIILVVDADGVLHHVSKAATTHLGYIPLSLLNLKYSSVSFWIPPFPTTTIQVQFVPFQQSFHHQQEQSFHHQQEQPEQLDQQSVCCCQGDVYIVQVGALSCALFWGKII